MTEDKDTGINGVGRNHGDPSSDAKSCDEGVSVNPAGTLEDAMIVVGYRGIDCPFIHMD